jgi:mannosyltransferase
MGGVQKIASAVLLAAIVAVAVFLRFDGLGQPSYWLDEILGQIVMARSAELPFWQWLGGVHPQHGPLYYLTQVLGRAAGEGEWAGRLFAALFGVATVPLLWIAARRATGNMAAASASALLLAASPLHVYYSREARPYALLVLLTTALLLAILLRKPVLAGCLAVLLAYTSVGSAAVIVSIASAAIVAAYLQRDSESRRALWISAAAVIVTLALLPVLYQTSATDAVEAGFGGWNAALFDTIVRGLAVTALGAGGNHFAAYAMLIFAIVGAIALVRRERETAAVVILMTLLPIAVNLGALQLADHFFAVRYITPALPAYLLLAGAGIAAVANVARRFAPVLAMLVAAALATQGWTAARSEAFRKLDWRAIAQTLQKHVRRGDVILAAEEWSEVSLRYYLGEAASVRVIHMKGWGIAEIVTQQSPAAWLVTAGSSADSGVREWMCRYPVVLASPLEGFRLHYAPSSRDFLHERSGPAELRAVSAALGDRGFTLRIGSDDAIAIGSGWALSEGSAGDTFRWAVGHRATLMFPRREPRNRVIRFHAYPMLASTLPPQRVHVLLNGTTVGAVTLAPQWSDYSIDAPASLWKEGMNTLTLDFARANAPNAFDPSSPDHRPLAAAFRRISIDDAGFDSNTLRRDRPLAPSMQLATDALLPDARTVRSKTRFPPAQLRRVPVEAFLGRLGFDPVSGWTKIARGDVRLEAFAETIAAGSDCEDNDGFVQRAFAILLERKPNDIERQDLLRRLREGTKREQVVVRITRADDFLK